MTAPFAHSAEIAEFMGIPHGANVLAITGTDGNGITVRMNLEHRIQTQRMTMPCLLTVEKDANTPRLPSYKRKLDLSVECLKTVSLKDFNDQDTAENAMVDLCSLSRSRLQSTR